VSVIQRQIEAKGLTTVCLSLFRPFTEVVKPPRALWVPFPFGRPFGAPNNRDIQFKVIRSALNLLTRTQGPVLEDFILTADEHHLDAAHQSAGKSCGLNGCNFDKALASQEESHTESTIPPYSGDFEEVREELRLLERHHENYLRQSNGRTQVGHSGVSPQTIESAAEFIHKYVAKQTVEIPPYAPKLPDADRQLKQNLFIRLCTDDLKAFCLESRLAEKGSSENAADYNDWLWLHSKVGGLIAAARDRVIETTDRSQDPNWILARAMVPRGYGESGYIRAALERHVDK
jgi:hypothetical protein